MSMDLPSRAEVVIVGGGINGIALSYYLAKKGIQSVVFEKGYVTSGATGRCGGGIRQQWGTKENIILARESVKIFEKIGAELEHPSVRFMQGGYLVLAHTEEDVEQFKKNIKLQNSLDVPTKLVPADEINDIVPELDVEGAGAIAAAWNPTDGGIHPIPLTYAYLRKSMMMGTKLFRFTEVTGIEYEEKNGVKEIQAVKTTKGTVRTNVVVNAAGKNSVDIAKMVGVELPNKPYRHEILALEPTKMFLKPMIISFRDNIYFRQTMLGDIIGGWSDPNEPPNPSYESTFKFAVEFTKRLTRYMPILSTINVIRQWAGSYDTTPDHKPILGKTPGVSDMIQINGFSGHGLMLAPITAVLMAELIEGKKPHIDIDWLSIERFKSGKIEKEKFAVG